MLKIFKHLRNSSFIIFIIILLLAGQASCELSLPTYTSNIINIGIQQSGIENSVPEVIRKSEMDKLFIFLSDKNKNTIIKRRCRRMTMKKYYEDKKSKFINGEELGSIFDLYDSYGFKTFLAKCRYSGG